MSGRFEDVNIGFETGGGVYKSSRRLLKLENTRENCFTVSLDEFLRKILCHRKIKKKNTEYFSDRYISCIRRTSIKEYVEL